MSIGPVVVGRRGVWAALSHASLSVALLIRNALISVCCAWIVTWWCSLGVVVSGRDARRQSYDEFLLWTLLWLQFFFCAAGTVMQATLLLRLHFVDRPGKLTTLRVCCWRILRYTLPVYFLVVIAVFTSTLGLSKLTSQPRLRAFKMEFYIGGSLTFAYWICLEVVGRYVFKTQTVQGRARWQQQLTPASGVVPVAITSVPRISVWNGWRRILIARTPIAFSVIAAAVYVQVLSTRRIHDEAELVALMAGNMLLKMFIQHWIKHVTLRFGVKNIRTMLLTISFPTVLIDTQLRVLLQRVGSTTLTIKGTVLMAAIEIALRLYKSLAIRRRLRRVATTVVSQRRAKSTHSAIEYDDGDVSGRQEKLLAFRSAELYADMSAEYIAMGCAVGILLCYWEHPKYRLGEIKAEATDGSRTVVANKWQPQQTAALLAQAAAEVLVDVLSSTFEATQGITFHAVRRQGSYVVLLFVATAVIGHALSTVVVVLRSALLSVAVAWLTAWTCSLGALFVRTPVAAQSYDTFMLGMLLWLQFFYCCNDTVLQSTALLRVRFLSQPDYRPTLLHCWWRVVRRSIGAYFVSLLLMIGLTTACAAADFSPSIRELKLEYYLSCLASFTHTISVGLICRTIYRNETVEGRERSKFSASRRRRTGPLGLVLEWSRLAVAWLPLLGSSIFSPVAVHLVTLLTIETQLQLVLLLTSSFALKALCQHIGRTIIRRKRITNPRTMFLAAAIPTVVIDTQVRILLQRVTDSHLTVYGTALMVLVEICTRVGKALITRRQLRRLGRLLSFRPSTRPGTAPPPAPVDRLHVHDSRSQLLAHRSAELFADMAAEYIAMGCSTAILFFYWDHPNMEPHAVAGHLRVASG
ncbi:hypothetical protein ATCC90586_005111 [Pythium insidiosum]|nr:hypothetical protein ATCC90586_005111 [Pythium insidiosum]